MKQEQMTRMQFIGLILLCCVIPGLGGTTIFTQTQIIRWIQWSADSICAKHFEIASDVHKKVVQTQLWQRVFYTEGSDTGHLFIYITFCYVCKAHKKLGAWSKREKVVQDKIITPVYRI